MTVVNLEISVSFGHMKEMRITYSSLVLRVSALVSCKSFEFGHICEFRVGSFSFGYMKEFRISYSSLGLGVSASLF